MARLLRKAIAVLAAYAIVIQALSTGVVVAAHVTPDRLGHLLKPGFGRSTGCARTSQRRLWPVHFSL